MRAGTGRVVLAAALLAGAAASSVRVDQHAGTWSDSFTDLAGLNSSRHLKLVPGGGASIDPAEQLWSLPGSAPFTTGTAGAGIEFEGAGSSGERVTLWQRVLQPGRGLVVTSACVPVGITNCPLDPAVKGVVNGLVYRGGGNGFPLLASGRADLAGWDTKAAPPGTPPACTKSGGQQYGGIAPFTSSAILKGPVTPPAGVPCAASISVSADHDGTTAPYLTIQFRNPATNAVDPGFATVNESDIGLPVSTSFAGMTHVTAVLQGQSAAAEWEVGALSQAGTERHCTVMGPVYLTALEGVYRSPVLDSLSDRTAWTRIEWEVDQNSSAADPSCGCPSPGSPITPIAISWDAGAAPPQACTQAVPVPVPGTGTEAVPAAVGGRYLAFCVSMFGRDRAEEVSAALRPGPGPLHFSGWRPVLHRLAARYYARAAEAMSSSVVPEALMEWNELSWDAETPGGSSVTVDLIASDGTVLYASVPRAMKLAGAVDPFRHPSFTLRARLHADPADPANRPVLRWWKVSWAPLGEPLILDRNSFAPALGESVSGLVAVRRAGDVRVRAHDAAGNTVARLLDGSYGCRTLRFSWDGKDTTGKPVASGVYFVTATTAGGAGTRKVAVRR